MFIIFGESKKNLITLHQSLIAYNWIITDHNTIKDFKIVTDLNLELSNRFEQIRTYLKMIVHFSRECIKHFSIKNFSNKLILEILCPIRCMFEHFDKSPLSHKNYNKKIALQDSRFLKYFTHVSYMMYAKVSMNISHVMIKSKLMKIKCV